MRDVAVIASTGITTFGSYKPYSVTEKLNNPWQEVKTKLGDRAGINPLHYLEFAR